MQLKSIIVLVFILTFLCSCKKEVPNTDFGQYTYSDDQLSVEEIAANFMATVDGGNFTMTSKGFQGGVNGENTDSNARRTKVEIEGRFFKPAPQPLLYGGYYVPNYFINSTQEINEIYDFFSKIGSRPTTNFSIYDTLGQPLIRFIFHNPTPIELSIDNQNYREAPAGSRIIVRWNQDANNKNGIAIALSGDKGLKYLHFNETGMADITDEVLKIGGLDRVSVTVTRGTVIIGKGADGRDYKLSNRTSKTESVYI